MPIRCVSARHCFSIGSSTLSTKASMWRSASAICPIQAIAPFVSARSGASSAERPPISIGMACRTARRPCQPPYHRSDRIMVRARLALWQGRKDRRDGHVRGCRAVPMKQYSRFAFGLGPCYAFVLSDRRRARAGGSCKPCCPITNPSRCLSMSSTPRAAGRRPRCAPLSILSSIVCAPIATSTRS